MPPGVWRHPLKGSLCQNITVLLNNMKVILQRTLLLRLSVVIKFTNDEFLIGADLQGIELTLNYFQIYLLWCTRSSSSVVEFFRET